MLHVFKFLLRLFSALIYIWFVLKIYQSDRIHEYLNDLKLHIEQDLYKYLQSNLCHVNNTIKSVDKIDILSQYKRQCPHHQYTTRLIERSPLIIYIEQFLSQDEIQHIIQLTESRFQPSRIKNENGTSAHTKNRTSSTAFLKRAETPIVSCLEQRFAKFQGEIELTHIEPLQVVKYGPDQEYKPHYDWFDKWIPTSGADQRVTTFFTYLQANCSMGETEFVDITFNRTYHERFCDILSCNNESEKHGIRFRPLPGNSIFWYNLDETGQVDFLTYHAARPPGKNGYKIGLNTWTRLKDFFGINDKKI